MIGGMMRAGEASERVLVVAVDSGVYGGARLILTRERQLNLGRACRVFVVGRRHCSGPSCDREEEQE